MCLLREDVFSLAVHPGCRLTVCRSSKYNIDKTYLGPQVLMRSKFKSGMSST